MMDTQLRNVHTFNLLPANTFQESTAYWFDLRRATPCYKPNNYIGNGHPVTAVGAQSAQPVAVEGQARQSSRPPQTDDHPDINQWRFPPNRPGRTQRRHQNRRRRYAGMMSLALKDNPKENRMKTEKSIGIRIPIDADITNPIHPYNIIWAHNAITTIYAYILFLQYIF